MPAIAAVRSIIDQSNHILGQFSPEDYKKPLAEYDGSSIGQHFRHILEFFHCLERGLETGVVDYAARERNLLYEDNPRLAAEAFVKVAEMLDKLQLDQAVQVRAEFGSDIRPEFPSTIGRELVFAFDHAIHHLAIIKIGLHCHYPQVSTDTDLGVSPSTIKYRQAINS